MSDEQIIFVIGAAKTGTTTLTLMLNAHPDIFILYESSVGMGSHLDKYTRRFLGVYPDARSFFYYGVTPNIFYPKLKRFLAKKGHPFKILGSDAPHFAINAKPLEILAPYKVIFVIRDIRTWLAKDANIIQYFTDNDIALPAIDYTISFLKSFLLPHTLKIRMNDIICQNNSVIDSLASFLGIPMRAHLDNWWKVSFPKDNPKLAQNWIQNHPSANFGPLGTKDTKVELASHPFWDKLLPIFDKYFKNPNGKISEKTVLADIEKIKSLKSFFPLKLNEAYLDYTNINLYPRGYIRKKILRQIGQEFKRARSMLKALSYEIFR